MNISINGTTLWFDLEGAQLVPAGPAMRERPTIILLHGGPGSYDHSYFKPEFSRLAALAQVVYLDLRGHGRSAWGAPEDFTFEACADDVRAFCDVLGIARPIVLGHSLGGFVAATYAARFPDHPGALVLLSTVGRFSVERVAAGFRRVGGDAAGDAAARFYAGDLSALEAFRTHCRPVFGRRSLTDDERARIVANPQLLEPGLARMRELDVLGGLGRVGCATLVCAGDLDPIASAEDLRDLAGALPAAQLATLAEAGHFPWLDQPAMFWQVLLEFVGGVSTHR